MTPDDLDRMEADYRRAEGNGHVISPVGALKLCAALRAAWAAQDRLVVLASEQWQRAADAEAERDEVRMLYKQAAEEVESYIDMCGYQGSKLTDLEAERDEARAQVARVEALCGKTPVEFCICHRTSPAKCREHQDDLRRVIRAAIAGPDERGQ